MQSKVVVNFLLVRQTAVSPVARCSPEGIYEARRPGGEHLKFDRAALVSVVGT